MFSELKKYKIEGHFFFKQGQNLKELTKDIPDLPGVYYIMSLAHGSIDIVYIGKSETSGLKSHLNSNFSPNLTRQDYFNLNCSAENIEALDIYWFVTIANKKTYSPASVEKLIIKRYSEIYQNLPPWNRNHLPEN